MASERGGGNLLIANSENKSPVMYLLVQQTVFFASMIEEGVAISR